MIKIKAKNKGKNLKGSQKLYYILVAGFLLTFLSFLLYRDIIVTFTLGLSTVVFYFLASKKPEDVVLEISEDGLSMDGNFKSWVEYGSFALMRTSENIELIFFIPTGSGKFEYLFFEPNQPGVKEAITYVTNHLSYNPEIPQMDKRTIAFRWLGIH